MSEDDKLTTSERSRVSEALGRPWDPCGHVDQLVSYAAWVQKQRLLLAQSSKDLLLEAHGRKEAAEKLQRENDRLRGMIPVHEGHPVTQGALDALVSQRDAAWAKLDVLKQERDAAKSVEARLDALEAVVLQRASQPPPTQADLDAYHAMGFLSPGTFDFECPTCRATAWTPCFEQGMPCHAHQEQVRLGSEARSFCRLSGCSPEDAVKAVNRWGVGGARPLQSEPAGRDGLTSEERASMAHVGILESTLGEALLAQERRRLEIIANQTGEGTR